VDSAEKENKLAAVSSRGLYTGKYPPPPGREYQLMSFRRKKYEK
jgi:hypothetical protein